jgi:cytochrome P450
MVLHSSRDATLHLTFAGDVVRIAPNDLVFVTPRAYKDIYGNSGKLGHLFLKTKFQDIGEKELGITAERDPEKHRIARKMLSPGFSARAFKLKEDVFHEHVDELVYRLNQPENSGSEGVELIQVCICILTLPAYEAIDSETVV